MSILLRAAKVLEIKENKIKVELFSRQLPSSCEAKGCSACKLSDSSKTIRYYPKSNFINEVVIDDILKIESKEINDGAAAAILFLTPIFFAAIFYYISVNMGISIDSALSVAVAIFGGGFGFMLAVIFDKIYRKLNPAKIFKE